MSTHTTTKATRRFTSKDAAAIRAAVSAYMGETCSMDAVLRFDASRLCYVADCTAWGALKDERPAQQRLEFVLGDRVSEGYALTLKVYRRNSYSGRRRLGPIATVDARWDGATWCVSPSAKEVNK